MPMQSASVTAQETFDRFMEARLAKGIRTDARRLSDVFQFAKDEYGEAAHWSGDLLIEHCLGVLQILSVFDPDDELVITCLLHHILDSKRLTLEDVERVYGVAVRTMISGEYLLSHVTMKKSRMTLEQMRLMFLKVSTDLRLVLLLLSHQNRILDQIEILPVIQRRQICRDALHIYAPVAARLGIYSLKHEMENKAFPVVYPTDASRITEQLESLHEKHGNFLPAAANALMVALRDAGIAADVQIREKQPYSIFHKMQIKSISHVEDLYDLFALRVIVGDQDTCYQALGVLHRIGHPVAGRFKDYIAFPKPNGYKSLHTTLAQLPGVPEGVFVEAQIRTQDMQREAEYGIAAHWTYKERGGAAERALQKIHLQRALLSAPDATLTGVRDQIFVLTPQGDVIELPEGASPLDFAFHVHSTLGLSFRAAKVNGAIVPLDHVLENGDIVEILKFRDPHPSPHWIAHLKSASARSRLKRYLITHERPLYLAMGRDAMNEELARKRLPQLDSDLSLLRLFDGKKIRLAEREELLIKIGQGAQNASSMLPHLTALKGKLAPIPMNPPLKKGAASASVVKVDGGISMPVLFAKCCKPDTDYTKEIAGVIGRTGEVRVHNAKCGMLKNVNPERRIGVSWTRKS